MAWTKRLLNLFRQSRLAREIDEEIQFHLDARAQQDIASGMSAEEARRSAKFRFGNMALIAETARETDVLAPLEIVVQDLRFAVRMMRRRPGFTVMAVLLLALGIGASTAMFSILLRAVFPKSVLGTSDRLVFLWRFEKGPGDFFERLSYPDLADIRGLAHSFSRLSIYRREDFAINTSGGLERVAGFETEPNWLAALGVSPRVGRNFIAGDRDVALLSNALWQRLFNGNANILGARISVNSRPFTIVGILPANFAFENAEIFTPLHFDAVSRQRNQFVYYALANLRSNISLAQAEAEIRAIIPGRENWIMKLATPKEKASRYCGPTCAQQHNGIWLLFGAAGAILLMACANVANLLLARSMSRRREFAIRTAIGCSRSRLIRQIATESLLLFSAGGALGILFACWFVVALSRFAAAYVTIPANSGIPLDERAFAFSGGTTLLTAIMFGIIPGIRSALMTARRGIRESTPSLSSPHHDTAWRVLTGSEFTLTLVLLIGFGLLLRSFLRVESIPVGIRIDHLLTTGTILNSSKYLKDSAQRIAFAHNLLMKIRAIPGVSAAALTSSLPLTGADDTRIQIEGQARGPTEVRYISASPGIFRTLEIPIVAGRSLSAHDSEHGAPVVVVNQTMARALFPNGNVIGSRIRMEGEPAVWREIVGIAADVRQRNLEEDSRPVFYRPYVQGVDYQLSFAVRVRSDVDMPEVAKALSKTVRKADPQQPWDPVKSMRQVIYDSESLSLRRPVVRLLGGFGVLALVLAAAGLFAVLSHSVAQRTREIGIRMAVGARQSQILRQIILETLRFAAPGAFIGALSAYWLSQLLPSGHIGWSGSGVFLYGVTRSDAVTYVGVLLALLSVSLAAAFAPARRAIHVDPSTALREE